MVDSSFLHITFKHRINFAWQWPIPFQQHYVQICSKDVEMPGIEPGASYMQSMRSTTELHPLHDHLVIIIIYIPFFIIGPSWSKAMAMSHFMAATIENKLWFFVAKAIETIS